MLTFETSIQSLEVPETIHTESWQQCQTLANSGWWQAYLNQICLQTVLPWLEETLGIEPIVTSPNTPQFWSLVNGSAIAVENRRFILVPTEAMDRSELRVPQEWVDIPTWVGDYYLAVEVDPDEQVLQVWGYCTHEQVKLQGQYDASDRTYCLTESDLIQDMAVFWVMQQVAPEPTRSEVSSLANLSNQEADTLIQQANHSEAVPLRLSIAFLQWGALLQNDRWLQRLCELSPSQSPQSPAAQPDLTSVQLGQWLQNQFELGWQTLTDLFRTEPDLAFSFRREETQATIRRVKQIHLAAELSDVVLAIALKPEPDERIRIGVQVLPMQGNAYLPAQLQLVMLSSMGEILQSVEASDQSNYIQLRRVKCSPGMVFRLQIRVADVSVTEDFVV